MLGVNVRIFSPGTTWAGPSRAGRQPGWTSRCGSPPGDRWAPEEAPRCWAPLPGLTHCSPRQTLCHLPGYPSWFPAAVRWYVAREKFSVHLKVPQTFPGALSATFNIVSHAFCSAVNLSPLHSGDASCGPGHAHVEDLTEPQLRAETRLFFQIKSPMTAFQIHAEYLLPVL